MNKFLLLSVLCGLTLLSACEQKAEVQRPVEPVVTKVNHREPDSKELILELPDSDLSRIVEKEVNINTDQSLIGKPQSQHTGSGPSVDVSVEDDGTPIIGITIQDKSELAKQADLRNETTTQQRLREEDNPGSRLELDPLF